MPLTQELFGDRKGLKQSCVLCREDSSCSEHRDPSGPRRARINHISPQSLRCLSLKPSHFVAGPCWSDLAGPQQSFLFTLSLIQAPSCEDLWNLSIGNVGMSEAWLWLSLVGDRTVTVVPGRNFSWHLLLSWDAGGRCLQRVESFFMAQKDGCWKKK